MPHVRIHDVTLRDGVQSLKYTVPTQHKTALGRMLATSGLYSMELGSFVSPKNGLYEKFTDTAHLLRELSDISNVRYYALVPSHRCYNDGVSAGFTNFATIVSASNKHNKMNTGCVIGANRITGGKSVEESLRDNQVIMDSAERSNHGILFYVVTAFGYENQSDVNADQLKYVAWHATLYKSVSQVALGDTFSRLSLDDMSIRLNGLEKIPMLPPVALHLHPDPKLYNWREAVNVAMDEYGIQDFHASLFGGGCPTDEHSANVNLVELAEHIRKRGVSTGIDEDELMRAREYANTYVLL